MATQHRSAAQTRGGITRSVYSPPAVASPLTYSVGDHRISGSNAIHSFTLVRIDPAESALLERLPHSDQHVLLLPSCHMLLRHAAHVEATGNDVE